MSTAFTAQDYQTAAIGDRLREIMAIINRLREFDLAKVVQLITKVQEIAAAESLKDKVRIGIDVLEIVAAMTETDSDDKLVALIRSIATDDVLEILARIVSGLLGTFSKQDATLAAADKQVVEAKGIPWAFLVQIAMQLLPLLQHFIDND